MIIDLYNEQDFHCLAALVNLLVESNDTLVGLFSGAWDQLHYYHIMHLQMAARLCDFLIVGVGTDRLVRHNKGPSRPIYPENHRIGMVDALRCVNACFLMDHENDFGLVAKQIVNKVDGVIFKNEDWLPRLDKIPGYIPGVDLSDRWDKDISDSLHGNVIIIPDIDNTSSTSDFIKKIRSFKE